MAENDNPAPADAVNPTGSDDTPPAQGSDDTPPDNGPTASERKLQSERDSLRSKVEGIEAELMSSRVEKHFNSFLSDNKEKYPDVTADDLMIADDLDKLDETAKAAQARFDRIRNDALSKVHDVPEAEPLSDEEYAKERKQLDESTDDTPGGSKFARFIQLQSKKRK